MLSPLGSRRIASALAAILVLAFAPVLPAQDRWDRAAREVVRLPPSDFPALPAAVRAELEARGCRIPQPSGFPEGSGPFNVIEGNFAAPRQKDWAVLCSRQLRTSLLVFWGGPTRCPAQFPEEPDRHWLQGAGGGRVEYSREITAVGADHIGSHYEAYGGPTPPEVTHQGIDEAFLGKASQVHYCYQGEWIVLQGAD